MKKILLSMALLIVTVLSLLASCAGGGNVAESGTAKIVIENSDGSYTAFDADLSKLENRNDGGMSLLKYIAEQEGSALEYGVEDGGYGAYVTEIGDIKQNAAGGAYIIIYTTEEADFAVPTADMQTVATVKYGELTLTSAGVGLSSLHINDGTVILFRLESYK